MYSQPLTHTSGLYHAFATVMQVLYRQVCVIGLVVCKTTFKRCTAKQLDYHLDKRFKKSLLLIFLFIY